ncbi:MAG: hypothetical protein JNG83_13580 [Opitutaceae bacterium]|nr:hypothetical protein [Opitutaceae bacterium]
MNQKRILKNIILTAAASLGLAVFARADVPLEEPMAAPAGQGLLGQHFATLTYSYIDLDDSPTHADGFTFAFNQPLRAGLDGILSYNWAQTGLVAGERLNQQSLDLAFRAFSTAYPWGKPYVEAGAGYAWTKFAGVDDNSFFWELAVGAELQVAPEVTVTPFIQYLDAPDLPGNGTWNFGVKGNYWVTSQWSVTAAIERDDDQNTAFTVGTNFRF